jgi:hypothetical protein
MQVRAVGFPFDHHQVLHLTEGPPGTEYDYRVRGLGWCRSAPARASNKVASSLTDTKVAGLGLELAEKPPDPLGHRAPHFGPEAAGDFGSGVVSLSGCRCPQTRP